MKKIYFTILLSFLLINISNAQSLKSGIAVTAVTPTGNFADAVGTGYGGVFMVKLGLPVIDVTGSVEYLNFSEKETANVKASSNMWSINAGARISVFPFISAGAELGNYWITTTVDAGNGDKDNSENKVAFTPLLAANFSMFEVSVRYAIISDVGFFSLRAGIYF